MLVPPIDVAMLTSPILWTPQHTTAVLATAVLTLVLLSNGRCFRARLHVSVLDELPWLLARFATAVAVVATVLALWYEQATVTSFLTLSLGTAALFLAGRVVTTQIILWGRRTGRVSHRTVIAGGGAQALELATILRRYPRYGLTVEGFVGDLRDPAAEAVLWLGPPSRLRRIIDERDIVVVLVADGISEVEILGLVHEPTARSWDLLVVPRFCQLHTQVGLPDHVGSIPVMRINNPTLQGPAWTLKRALDVAVSVVALLVLVPLLLLTTVAVRLEGGPGVLFRQERVGRHGETFTCLKFRSMIPADSAESATQWAVAHDTRVGSVGRLLRRTSLDELPQLWNVLRGDMTLVGPRPERPHFVDKFSAEIPSYGHRHRVRAGLTGFAQVSGLRGDTPINDRARFDNYYIENWSLWLDAKILIRTVGEVLFARGR